MLPKNPFQNLNTDSEIKEFYQNYVNALRENNVKNPQGVAKRHIGYLVPINNSIEVVKRWTRLIPEINPILYLEEKEFELLKNFWESNKRNL